MPVNITGMHRVIYPGFHSPVLAGWVQPIHGIYPSNYYLIKGTKFNPLLINHSYGHLYLGSSVPFRFILPFIL